MTKEDVLQGALTLNDSNKKYTVTVEDNKIIIESKYSANPTNTRTGTFRFTARLKDNNTYTETFSDNDGRRIQYGNSIKVKKSISFTLGVDRNTVDVEKRTFNSEDIKKILRDYLESCGYTKASKGFFKRLFKK